MDAYAIRKMVPRIVIGVIAINLSIYFCVAMIDIFTIVGNGLGNLMTRPFVGTDTFDFVVGNGSATQSVLGGVAGAGGAAVFAGVVYFAFKGGDNGTIGNGVRGGLEEGTMWIIMFVLIPIVLIGLAVLFTLVIRQGLLVFLTIVSPVAIALYILPGTEKYFRQWLDLFIKTLMVYPIIAAVFAMSDILSSIIFRANTGLTGVIVGIIVMVIPLLMIPFAFKLSGGVIGSIGGFATSRASGYSKRAQQGIAKSRQDPTSFLGKRAVANKDARVGAGLTPGAAIGNTISGIRTRRAGGRFREGFDQGRTARADIAMRQRAREATQNPMVQQLGFDDNAIAVLALSGGSREGAERVSRTLATANNWTEEQRLRALESASSVGFSTSNAAAAIDVMAQNKSRALSGALGGDAGMELVRQSATEISGGNDQLTENMMGGFAYHSRNATRFDLGGETAGESATVGWQRSTPAAHAQAYGPSTQHFTDSFQEQITTGATVSDRRAAAVAFSEMAAALPNASAENRDIINGALAGIGVDRSLTKTITSTRNMTDTSGNLLRNADGSVRTEQYQEVVPLSVEEQLAHIASGRAASGMGPARFGEPAVTAAQIHADARKYGDGTPLEAREGAPTPTPPTAGGAGTP